MLNINHSAVVKFTNTLEKMKRSALPSAIRGTLNNAAFDVKTSTMPEMAKDAFVERKENFFKANSKVEMATGFEIRTMKATVGFVDKGNLLAVQELQEQEEGGTLDKSFIPLDTARGGESESIKGGSYRKLVRPNARLKAIKNIVNIKLYANKNPRERLLYAALRAGRSGFVLAGGKLWKINSMTRDGKNTVIKKTALYSFKKGRKVTEKPTHFMQAATLKTTRSMNEMYIKNAEFQIAKYG